MKFWCSMVAGMMCVAAMAGTARAADFADEVDLAPLQTIAVQHNQTMKTLDSFARQILTEITGRSSLDGHSAIFTLMDMSFRPESYINRNIIKIKNVPLRQEFLLLDSIDDKEKQRIVHDGLVSLTFLARQDVQTLLQNAQATTISKSKAIGEVIASEAALREVCEMEAGFIPAAIVPPAKTEESDHLWHRLIELVGNDPVMVSAMKAHNITVPDALPHYESKTEIISNLFIAREALQKAWLSGNAANVNASVVSMAGLLEQINPAVYPSHAKRSAEVTYNHLMRLTIPGAAFYFIALVLFLMSARSGFVGLRIWGLRFMAIAFFIHTVGIGIRWWLVGDIFPPIKNEFESVMFSAWFGALVGMILEIRRSRGIFGAAASFVGTLSLVAIFAAPYVTGKEIGGEIGQVQGILMSYWLYIHVTMVTASYALIGMGFMLSVWWLVRYYMDFGTLRRMPPTLLSSDAMKSVDVVRPAAGGRRQMDDDLPSSMAGAALSVGFAQTLGMMLFMPRPAVVKAEAPSSGPRVRAAEVDVDRGRFLAMLDMCNLVVLQLAFWVLGAGIICGAIWADQSWGRPWGWDPKETFALVTWIVYLIVVHVRVATDNKAWWTAVLSCIGFFVMLFNWIGVNFLLVGLHSYA